MIKTWATLLSVIALAGLALGQNAPLTQQKMCTEQAAKRFQEVWEGATRPDFLIYTSHFDPHASTCYMLVKSAQFSPETSKGYTYIEINDAFEKRRWAHFTKYGEDNVVSCYLTSPRSKEVVKCKTQGEFEDLAEKYFGISY
jgi:hypothetical protein